MLMRAESRAVSPVTPAHSPVPSRLNAFHRGPLYRTRMIPNNGYLHVAEVAARPEGLDRPHCPLSNISKQR
jgi:hypothetical protein